MRGGLLGAGHSWVAGLIGSSTDMDPTSNVATPAGPLQQQQQALGILRRLTDWVYNAKEDTLDTLSAEAVRIHASRGALLCGSVGLLAVAFTFHSLWST